MTQNWLPKLLKPTCKGGHKTCLFSLSLFSCPLCAAKTPPPPPPPPPPQKKSRRRREKRRKKKKKKKKKRKKKKEEKKRRHTDKYRWKTEETGGKGSKTNEIIALSCEIHDTSGKKGSLARHCAPGVGGVGVGGRWEGEVLGGVETANIRLGRRRVEKKV